MQPEAMALSQNLHQNCICNCLQTTYDVYVERIDDFWDNLRSIYP